MNTDPTPNPAATPMMSTIDEPCVPVPVHAIEAAVSIIETVTFFCDTNPAAAAGLAHLFGPDVDADEIATWADALAGGLRRRLPVTP